MQTDKGKLLNNNNQLREAIDRLAFDAQELQMEKCRYQAVLNSAAEGMIVVSEDGQLSEINPMAKKLLSLPQDFTKGNMADLKDYLSESLFSILCDSLHHNNSYDQEMEIADDLFIRLIISPIKDWSGKSVGFVIVLNDISQQKIADKNKAEFISTASHELRSPIAISLESMRLLKGGYYGQLEEKQSKIINLSLNAMERLLRVINDLLDLSKMEAGKMSFEFEDNDLVQIIKEVGETFRERLSVKGLNLDYRLPQQCILSLDKDKIIQVLTNLLSNASKFTKEGSISISLDELDNEVKFSVCDTGMGLSPEEIPHLFNKYKQFGHSKKVEEKGTGLGLSIIKKIVDGHHGSIDVESSLGEGSCFIIKIPKNL